MLVTNYFELDPFGESDFAAEARGWSVCWYDRERVPRDAKAVLGGKDVEAFLRAMGKSAGPPWQAIQKLAATAALVAQARK